VNLFRVSRTVGQEQSIILVLDRVKVVVPWKDGNDSISLDEGSENVGFGSEIENGDSRSFTVFIQCVDFLGGCLGDEVVLGWVPVFGTRRDMGDIVPNGQSTEGSSLVSK
jgi:hypothetical protein